MTTPSATVSTTDISFSEVNPALKQKTDTGNVFRINPRSSFGNLSPTESERRKTTDSHHHEKLFSLFETRSFQHHFQPNTTILLHGEPIKEFHLVVSGVVRCCAFSPEGARQIFRFAKKGEFVGISDIDSWHFTAEAVDHVIVKSITHAQMKQALASDSTLRDEIRAHVCDQLKNRERQLLSMVSAKASERLFNFLYEFASSRPTTGYITLPMCRRDIADHLGLSAETVSRTFSELKRKGCIDLANPEKYRICTETGIDTATQGNPRFA